MHKKRLTTIAIASVITLAGMFALTAKLAYEWGERRTAELILHSALPSEESRNNNYTPPSEADQKTISSLRDQLNRLTNDYDSACYNYQELYAAYDKLYAQAGSASGEEKIAQPDGARGNETSCYR